MTAQQALRRERRRHMRQQERKLARESIISLVLVIILIIAAFNLIRLTQCGGMTEPELEAAQLEYWEERGITVARW